MVKRDSPGQTNWILPSTSLHPSLPGTSRGLGISMKGEEVHITSAWGPSTAPVVHLYTGVISIKEFRSLHVLGDAQGRLL